MSRLYPRRYSLIAADEGGAGLDVSELRATFVVKQVEQTTPCTADIRLHNVAPATAARFGKEFTRIVLQAGYPAQYGTIFQGTIVQARRGRSSPTDTHVDITAGDSDRAHNFAVVNTTLAAGCRPADVHRALCAATAPMGAEAGYVPELPGPALPRGRVLYGMARQHLRDLADATDTVWNIQDGKVVFTPRTGYLPGEAVVLTSETGLIGQPQQTQDGILVRCLLNPLLRLGNRIRLDNASIQEARVGPIFGGPAGGPGIVADERQSAGIAKKNADGFYVVLAIDHTGDTRGQEWYSDLTCLALDGTLTAAQGQRGLVVDPQRPNPLPLAG